jgi:hypothetical protein
LVDIAEGDPTENPRQSGPNWWGAFDPEDPAFRDVSDLANHPDMGFLVGHGNPRYMSGLPPMSTVRALHAQKGGGLVDSLTSSGAPIVLDSCFGGATFLDESNAQLIADASGVPRDLVYGCTEKVTSKLGHLNCGGQWVDGNKQPIPTTPSSFLRNCTLRLVWDSFYVAEACH